LSKVLKARQTSFTQQSYLLQVKQIRQPELPPEIDPEGAAIMSQAEQEAERIRAEAYAEAARIIRNAELDAQSIMESEQARVQGILEAEVEQAKRLGYEEGRSEGEAAAKASYKARFLEVESLYLHAVDDRKKYLADAEPMIVDMACAIAKKVMHRDPAVPRDWIVEVVRAALDEIHDSGKIEVRVHPEDFELVQANREGLRKEVPGQTDLLVIPDRGVEAGGCVVHTAFGNIDARIDTQLEEVRKALQEVAAGLSHEPTSEA